MDASLFSHPVQQGQRPPPPARLLWQFRHDPPTYTLDNVYEQASHYTDVVYLAIRTLWKALSAATVQLVKERKPGRLRKALSGPGAQGAGDEKFAPILGHPLAKLLRRPNPKESFSKFLARALIQRSLHGRLLVWGPKNRAGAPCELYVLPTAMCQPVQPSATYPEGAWRVSQTTPGLTWAPIGAYLGAIGEIIDAREVYKWDDPHPLYPWLPYSPLTGTARQIDLAQQIDKAAWSLLQHAPAPSGVIDVPGASQAELDAMEARFGQKHGGPNNHGKVLYLGGEEREGKSAASFTPITGTLKDSPLAADREWVTGFVLAVFGLTRISCGLKDTGSYAELFADLKKIRVWTLDPFASELGDFLTHGPVADWFPDRSHDVRAQVDLPKLEDPETVEKRIGDGSEVFLVNERRGMAGLDPLPGGDVLSDTFAASEMQAHNPQPDPMALGAVPGERPQPGQPGKPQPGVGGKPGGPPSIPRPANPAGKGSLPPRMTKALCLAFVEESVTSHVLAALGIEDDDTAPILKALGWDESKHKRDELGEFAAAGRAARREANHRAYRLASAGGKVSGDFQPGTDYTRGIHPPPLPQKLADAAPHVAAATADVPGVDEHLDKVKGWAGAKAAEHAHRVAVKLGVSPEKARAILERAIVQLAQHAAAHGGRASGTLRVGGKEVKLSIGGTARCVIGGALARDAAPRTPRTGFAAALAGAGIKALGMSELSGPDGGFLADAPAPAPAPKRARCRRRGRRWVRSMCMKAMQEMEG